MQFEEFDNKIREAASHHHPPYDEKAWAGMEKLLDKHLPQEKDDRRRIFFILFLFLLLGGAGAWLFISKPWKGNSQGKTAHTSIQKPTGENKEAVSSNNMNRDDDNNNITGDGNNKIIGGNNRKNNEGITGFNLPGTNQTHAKQNQPVTALLNPVNKKDRQNHMSFSPGSNKKITTKDHPKVNDAELTGINIKRTGLDLARVEPQQLNNQVSTVATERKGKTNGIENGNSLQDRAISSTKPAADENPAMKDSQKKSNEPVQASAEKKKKDQNKKRNSFFLTLSTGPDVSATPGDQLGKTKLLVGGGMGYTIKDRFTIRSGFYRARKLYTSSPGSYHPPANFWNYYPNLEKVDGDCKVYEIPLSLSYQFGHANRRNWFVSSGLSSYLMKKETYKYYYKYIPTGQTLTRQYSPKNKNNNYFSVLTVSGGYQKNIGKNFSLTVEPYIKMPLSGVGLGNVKLNSGGVLLSVGFKPFSRDKKTAMIKH